jgi:hypothetical protein
MSNLNTASQAGIDSIITEVASFLSIPTDIIARSDGSEGVSLYLRDQADRGIKGFSCSYALTDDGIEVTRECDFWTCQTVKVENMKEDLRSTLTTFGYEL